jgi:2'-5' RNA ligase
MPVIGIAVPIPEPHGTELQSARERFGDAMAAKIPPHVTLLPPTELSAAEESELVEHLALAARGSSPFRMSLRGTGTFRPVSPVVFVQVARGIPECEPLERAVRQGPVDREPEFPYHPHVTIAHHLDDEALDTAFDALADYRVDFDVVGFDLYHHGADDVWRSVRTFALGGGDRQGEA